MPAVAEAIGSYSFFERHRPGFVRPRQPLDHLCQLGQLHGHRGDPTRKVMVGF